MQHIEILRKIRAFGLKGTDNRMVLIKKLNIEFVSPSERQITLDWSSGFRRYRTNLDNLTFLISVDIISQMTDC